MREVESERDLKMLHCWFEDRGWTHEPKNFLEAGKGKQQILSITKCVVTWSSSYRKLVHHGVLHGGAQRSDDDSPQAPSCPEMFAKQLCE